MQKWNKWYTLLTCVFVACISIGLIYYTNNGVPAVNMASYVQVMNEPLKTQELALKQETGNRVPGMQLAAENDRLALFYNQETTEFAILDKLSNKLWQSNPEELKEDGIASSFEKEVMASNLLITFRNDQGRIHTFSSFAESVKRGQYTTESIDNGFRLTYTLGDMSLGIDALPRLISKQRMEEKILSKLDDTEAKYMLTKYFPLASNPEILERLDTAVSRELVLKRMIKTFQENGYTEEDLAFDNKENGIEGDAEQDRPVFTIPLDIKLDGSSLVASVPTHLITESEGYSIRMINLLNFFGAAGTEQEGYMLVPDGTGSLIYLNNGKTNAEIYAQRLYGEDLNDNSRRRGQVAESARLPVFGMKVDNEAWYAVIEKGDAIASINADISGRNNSYNNIFVGFAIRGEDELEIYKGTTIEEIQRLTKARYKGDLQVRFSFLSGEEADYSGMAKHYRESLEKQGVFKSLSADRAMPFYLSVLGAVDKRKSFLGIPYKGMVSLTTFEQASDIAKQLEVDGVSNLRMRYLGWFNEGLTHEVPDHIDIESVLGSEKEFQSLSNQVESMGGMLYPDVAFQHVFQTDGSFAPASDAARYVTREQAERAQYNRTFNSMDRNLGVYYLLSPAKLPYYVESFADEYQSLGIDAISLRDLGDMLHSDYNTRRVIFRDTAKDIVKDQLGVLKERYSNLLITGGNVYAVAYAEQIVNVPTTTSLFNITDEEVPFYQMVLHGYVDYAGSPINLDNDQDMTMQLLRSIELGAAPHFLWSHESSSKLKFTPYDIFYSTAYTSWYNQAMEMYRKVNDALLDLRTVKIAERIRHAEGVVEMQYMNGTSVYVNYTDKAVSVGGNRIDAKNFKVGDNQ